jgi:hypothetical protein
MRKLAYAAAAAILSLGSTACQNALADDTPAPLTGTWRFTATGYRATPHEPAVTCDHTTTFVIRQVENYVEGYSLPGTITCTGPNAPAGPQTFNASGVSGEVENGRLTIFTSLLWQCFAELHPTRMEGYMESYSEYVGEGHDPIRAGTCMLEKISDEGFDGTFPPL